MYGRPQDVVVWVNPRTQRGKQFGGLAIGLLFVALGVGCVVMMVVEKTLIPLVALGLLGLAMFGWYTSQRQANARATSSATINPALVVDDSGVGDAAVRIPWSDIARVNVISTRYRSVGPESVGLGPELADRWTRSAGVLDGEFALEVVLRPGRLPRNPKPALFRPAGRRQTPAPTTTAFRGRACPARGSAPCPARRRSPGGLPPRTAEPLAGR